MSLSDVVSGALETSSRDAASLASLNPGTASAPPGPGLAVFGFVPSAGGTVTAFLIADSFREAAWRRVVRVGASGSFWMSLPCSFLSLASRCGWNSAGSATHRLQSRSHGDLMHRSEAGHPPEWGRIAVSFANSRVS